MRPKSESTRQRILESASALFYEKGILNTSQQEIADRAGINRGLIHYYFGTKESIACHIFIKFNDDFFDVLSKRCFADEEDAIYVSIARGRIILNFLLTHENVKRFYVELMTEQIVNEFIEESVLLDLRRECVYLNLNISEEELRLYSAILASVECRMMSMQIMGTFSFPIEDFISMYNRIHLNLLGVDENTAQKKIERAIAVSRKVSFQSAGSFDVRPELFIVR